MVMTKYLIVGSLSIGLIFTLISLSFYKVFSKSDNWLPVLLILMSMLVLWLASGMPAMKLMTGYPFLITYSLAIFSLVGIPVLGVTDICFIFLKKGFEPWPYHIFSLILAGLSMILFLTKEYL
jgi:hypothetical protein